MNHTVSLLCLIPRAPKGKPNHTRAILPFLKHGSVASGPLHLQFPRPRAPCPRMPLASASYGAGFCPDQPPRLYILSPCCISIYVLCEPCPSQDARAFLGSLGSCDLVHDKCAQVNKSAETSEAPGPGLGALRFQRLGSVTKLTAQAGTPRRAAPLCASVSSVGNCRICNSSQHSKRPSPLRGRQVLPIPLGSGAHHPDF